MKIWVLQSGLPGICCCSFVKSCLTPCDPMSCSTPGFPVLHHLPVCSDLYPLSQWCHPTISSSVVPFSSCLQSSPQLAFCIRWLKYWSFSPSSEYWGLTSFGIDCFGLLAVQGTLKSLPQHNWKASVLQCSAFFMVQLSHLFMGGCGNQGSIWILSFCNLWAFRSWFQAWVFLDVALFSAGPHESMGSPRRVSRAPGNRRGPTGLDASGTFSSIRPAHPWLWLCPQNGRQLGREPSNLFRSFFF